MVYPDFVKNIQCYPKGKNYRYYIKAELKCSENDQRKTAMIIMQNPSMADEKRSDRTVNRVLNYMHNFGYGYVIIANIIPFYGTKIQTIPNSDLNNKKILNKNCEIIHEESKQADKIFVAWGWANAISPSYYKERIESVKKHIVSPQKVYCYLVNESNGQPRHPRRWKRGKKEEEFVKFQF